MVVIQTLDVDWSPMTTILQIYVFVNLQIVACAVLPVYLLCGLRNDHYLKNVHRIRTCWSSLLVYRRLVGFFIFIYNVIVLIIVIFNGFPRFRNEWVCDPYVIGLFIVVTILWSLLTPNYLKIVNIKGVKPRMFGYHNSDFMLQRG
jgi:hypothetical protein